MLTQIRQNPWLFALAVLFLLAAISLTLFHHHEDGQHSGDCAVCRLVQIVAGLVVLAVIIFVPVQQRPFAIISSLAFTSYLSTSLLKGRSPPYAF